MPEKDEGKLCEIKKAVKCSFKYTLPVLTGFIALGMAYGILMQQKGFNALWSLFISATAFCGSMQYVLITMMTAAFDPAGAFFMSLMVNARHLFYGISMLKKYGSMGKARFFLIYLMCDETFSVCSSVEPPKGVNAKYFYLSISVLDYLYWVTASFLGGVIGKLMTFNAEGLDFVLTALFVVLFVEQMMNKVNRASGIVGVLSSVAALVIFGADNLVVPAMIIILAVTLIIRRVNKNEHA